MNIDLIVILTILWGHFVSDFCLQTDKMATSKSGSVAWLSIHVSVYSIVFLIFFGPLYAAANFILHWVTDFCTSRITSYFWKKEMRHEFFATIGADQSIHFTCLFMTLPLADFGWLFKLVLEFFSRF